MSNNHNKMEQIKKEMKKKYDAIRVDAFCMLKYMHTLEMIESWAEKYKFDTLRVNCKLLFAIRDNEVLNKLEKESLHKENNTHFCNLLGMIEDAKKVRVSTINAKK